MACLWRKGRTFDVGLFVNIRKQFIDISVLSIGLSRSGSLGVVVIPHHGVVHVVGEHIARIVTQIVRGSEDIVEGCIDRIVVIILDVHRISVFINGSPLNSRHSHGIITRVNHLHVALRSGLQLSVFRRQHHVACRVIVAANLTAVDHHVSLFHEAGLLGIAHQAVVPVTDGVVQLVSGVVDDDGLVGISRLVAQLVAVLVVVGIVVGLHLAQRHATVGGGGDGERHLHLLSVGIGRAGEGRDILVVDVDGASDEPVVGRRLRVTVLIDTTVRIAVVYNLLGVVDEVTRCLDLVQ